MSTGFNFGAKPKETPALGQTTVFGAPPQYSGLQTGTPSTNASAMPQFNSAMGSRTAAGGFQFSTPTTTTPSMFGSPSFNLTSPTNQSSFKPAFGTSLPNNTNAGLTFTSPTSSLNTTPMFGTPGQGSTLFGTPASSAGIGLSFGTPKTTTALFSSQPSSMKTTGVNFNTSIPQATSTGGLTFNMSAAPSSLSFGTLPSSVPNSTLKFGAAPTTGLSFGTTPTIPTLGGSTAPTFGTSMVPPTFGTLTTAPTFGSSSTAPAFGTSATVPSFGLSTAAPTFGTSTTGPSFGASTAAPTFAASTAAPTFGLSSAAPNFGTSSIPSTFGTSSAPPAFGTPTARPNFGSSAVAPAPKFGTPSSIPGFGNITTVPTFSTGASAPAFSISTSAPTTAPTAGLLFNSTQPSATTSLHSFGVTSTNAQSTAPLGFNTSQSVTTQLSYPTTQVTTTQTPSLPFSTSTPALTNTGLKFGPSTVSTGGTLFAVPAATTPSASFGTTTSALTPATATTSAFTAPTTSIAPGLSFGTSTTTPLTTSTGLTFGQNVSVTATSTPTTTSTSLSLGLGGTALLKPPATTSSLPTFGATPQLPTTSATLPVVGLGGVSSTPSKQTATSGPIETLSKDQILPNELLQTVENFKKFLQEQKSYSSEIARFSIKELKRVETDVDLVNNLINEMENELQKNKAMADNLKLSSAKDLQNVEMAQRTFDTPSGLQYDNVAPFNYFIELADNFEKDMHSLKLCIENIERHVKSTGLATALSPEDLTLGMRRLHETFVALAGRLQTLHNQVEYQKDQYLHFRKQLLHDYTNVFETQSKESEALEIALDTIAHQPPKVSTGPTPFSSLGNSQAQIIAQNPQSGFGSPKQLVPPTSWTSNQSNTPFGTSLGNTSLFNTSTTTGFNLQKPPSGNKRGKP